MNHPKINKRNDKHILSHNHSRFGVSRHRTVICPSACSMEIPDQNNCCNKQRGIYQQHYPDGKKEPNPFGRCL